LSDLPTRLPINRRWNNEQLTLRVSLLGKRGNAWDIEHFGTLSLFGVYREEIYQSHIV